VIELLTLLLVLMLSVVLTLYNARQASALQSMERLVEDFVSMEMRERREKRAAAIDIEPLAWLEKFLPPDVKLVEVARVEHDVSAVDIRTRDGRRVVVSPKPKSELRRFDRARKKGNLMGKGGRDVRRVTALGYRPLLKHRLRLVEVSMSRVGNEWFDLEAAAAGRTLGVDWGRPTRLFLYIVG